MNNHHNNNTGSSSNTGQRKKNFPRVNILTVDRKWEGFLAQVLHCVEMSGAPDFCNVSTRHNAWHNAFDLVYSGVARKFKVPTGNCRYDNFKNKIVAVWFSLESIAPGKNNCRELAMKQFDRYKRASRQANKFCQTTENLSNFEDSRRRRTMDAFRRHHLEIYPPPRVPSYPWHGIPNSLWPFPPARQPQIQVESNVQPSTNVSFLWDLHNLLEFTRNCGCEEIISWVGEGPAFAVDNRKLFSSELWPHYCSGSHQHKTFENFADTLDALGFLRIDDNGGGSSRNKKREKDRVIFVHPDFQRVNPSFLEIIQKSESQKKKPPPLQLKQDSNTLPHRSSVQIRKEEEDQNRVAVAMPAGTEDTKILPMEISIAVAEAVYDALLAPTEEYVNSQPIQDKKDGSDDESLVI